MRYRYLILLLLLVTFTSPLFFYKLGQSSLVSFDEAWYAEISRQLLISGTPFSLHFNDRPFVDHPPAGFWLTASTEKILGVNELGARAGSAIAGLITLAVIFVFGSLAFHPAVGLASAIALTSSPWFIFRSRSGNLDVYLTLFYLLTLCLAYISVRKPRYIGAFFVSFTVLILTKTASPFTVVPALIFIFWKSPVVKTRKFILSLSLSLITIFSYFLLQLVNVPGYLRRVVVVASPPTPGATLWYNLSLVKTYLHSGLGIWFKPAVLSIPLFFLFYRKSKLLILLIALIAFLLPFTLSPKTQIWHLVPAHPLLILICFSTLYLLFAKISKKLAVISVLLLSLSLSLSQIVRNWREFINVPAFISDEAILSRQASRLPYPLVIDENFVPAAVFYSGKHVAWINSPHFASLAVSGQPTLVITHSWRLERDNVPSSDYKILASDRDKIIILYSPAAHTSTD